MKALITGAGSGIGRAFAVELDKMGYDTVLVGRNREKLAETASLICGKSEIIISDLSDISQCKTLYEKARDIDVLINNAGVGVYGPFLETDLQKELNLINVNCVAPHILTKLYLVDFCRKNSGKILNISSSAAFTYGPFLSAYYGSKAYIERFTRSVSEEIKNTEVYLGVCCPGPVCTEFTVKSGGNGENGISPEYVARYALKKMLRCKKIIVPGMWVRLGVFFTRFLPESVKAKIGYGFQIRKKTV